MRVFKSVVLVLMVEFCVPAVAFSEPFTITSIAFKDGGLLTVRNAGALKTNPNCVGENVSPPLAWNDPPAGTKSFAFVLFDPDGRNGVGVYHWVAYGIPSDLRGFAEGEISQPSDKYVGGKNTAGLGSYFGPCSPAGTGLHHYNFTLIATDIDSKELEPGLTRDALIEKLAGHAKGAATIVGLFER